MSQRIDFGFPAKSKYEFRLNGRRFRVGQAGVRTLRLLSDIYTSHSKRNDSGWLLSYRCRIEQLWMTLGSRSVLCLVVERTGDPTLRIFAIWLRGHCGGHLGTPIIAQFWRDPDETTRKEVARSLKRLESWSQLRKMAELEPNKRIKKIATAGPSRPYQLRLDRFAEQSRRIEVSSTIHELVMSPNLVTGQSRPPKPAWLIRMILNRIHGLVSSRTQ
jgi:hypothetical protein